MVNRLVVNASIILIFFALGTQSMEVISKDQQTILPTVSVSLGDQIQEVKARSTMPIHLEELKDRDILVAQEPNSVIYTDSRLGFTLPEARYVSITTTLGIVTKLEISPQLTYFNIDQATAKVMELNKLFDKASWKRDPMVRSQVSAENLRAKFEEKTSNPRLRQGGGYWKNGDDELYVTLERKHKVGEPYAQSLGYTEDKYLVTIVIYNKPREDQLFQKMILQRQQDGYHDEHPLSSVGKKKN